ncbi:ROK family transcriptional regulator [Rhodococcoides corynebacterioides]|uniref:ROK family protein n=1 Tax=Rhodococcoides corynebacterioides TaxID=53972 RepID=A0ABS7P5N8_9NOCA|nr:ROK family transcriptional regulator [Rhodococcus corynebacterioides]MBY6367741.1 ROK family protein [Rhodococcus corynebacterioides]MBY6408500.1 ROK family protein [Rhodococcus corynebacterioides]
MRDRSARSALVRAVHLGGARTRAELAEDLSLNRSTVKSLVDDLVADGLVTEHPSTGGGAGRPSLVVDPVAESAWVLAVDAAVDWVAFSAIGWGGTTLAEIDHETGAGRAPGDLVDRIAAAAEDLTARVGTPPRAVCVAVPGLVRSSDGMVRVAPNLGWRDVPLGRLVGDAVGATCTVANESDLGAVAEHTRGCARGIDDVVYLFAEFGVGAGIIGAGTLLGGSGGYAGEVGHMRATRRGRRCSCGSDGCWELSVGQEALRDALGLAGPARPAALARAIADLAARGGALPDAYVEDLATGVCTIVTMVDPRAVVFGGLFADVLGVPSVMDHVRAAVNDCLVGRQHGVALHVSSLGRRISVIGAAELAFAQVLPRL